MALSSITTATTGRMPNLVRSHDFGNDRRAGNCFGMPQISGSDETISRPDEIHSRRHIPNRRQRASVVVYWSPGSDSVGRRGCGWQISRYPDSNINGTTIDQ